jgi:hypothetical protein
MIGGGEPHEGNLYWLFFPVLQTGCVINLSPAT